MDDFLVIGGGIAGLSAGAALSEMGRVVVLEAEDGLGYHTSGRSAAMYEESYGAPPVIALNKATRPALEEGGYMSPRGLMLVGTRDSAGPYETDMREMSLAPLSVDEMLALVPILNPDTVIGGGWHGGAWDIDTDRLMQDRARTIRAAGGRVETRRRVTAIHRDGAGWRVETEGGEESARVLVNAAGSWADEIARIAGIAPLGFQPYRRSMARLSAPGGNDLRAWPMLFGAGETWYAKPDAGALLVSPSEEHPMAPHDAFPDDMVLAEGLARYQEAVTVEVTRPIATWAGLRTFAPDRALVLGPDPSDPTFVWSAGQGGYGFQTSTAAARLVADLVGGRPSELPGEAVAALRPDRLRA